MVEDIVGCKWSLAVLAGVRAGTRRPGALEHSLPGLTAKVLNERLRKLVRYGILERTQFPEIPPRVEYTLTPFGTRFAVLLDGVAELQREIDGAGGAH
jgi:DNA-binding HxlR family transcriptional regulator